MRTFPDVALTASLVLLCGLVYKSEAQTSPSESGRTPVVVELFTSEGCSSCPPADALLQKLQAQQPIAGAQIIPIEEHVDYWNHDGWVDPYSSPDWTKRQQDYADLTKKDISTPELVVDGRSQLSGNNIRQTGVEIANAARGAKTEVAIKVAGPRAKDSQQFSVSVGKLEGNATGGAEVWLAVTEDGLHSSVSRGENSGHELHHVATLRWLHKIGTADAGGAESFSGSPVVKFNSKWNVENLHVTVFLQKKKSREILGAATMKIEG